MPTFPPVTTLAELDALDGDWLRAGFDAGEAGLPEPGEALPRDFHHGWRMGRVKAGHAAPDAAACALVAAIHVAVASGCWETEH